MNRCICVNRITTTISGELTRGVCRLVAPEILRMLHLDRRTRNTRRNKYMQYAIAETTADTVYISG